MRKLRKTKDFFTSQAGLLITKKCNLTLKWAHLPISLNISNSLTGICQHSCPPNFLLWASLSHGQTYRIRCIWAHRAYAQVGSKTDPLVRFAWLFYNQTKPDIEFVLFLQCRCSNKCAKKFWRETFRFTCCGFYFQSRSSHLRSKFCRHIWSLFWLWTLLKVFLVILVLAYTFYG